LWLGQTQTTRPTVLELDLTTIPVSLSLIVLLWNVMMCTDPTQDEARAFVFWRLVGWACVLWFTLLANQNRGMLSLGNTGMQR
jgi:hypothetical protein